MKRNTAETVSVVLRRDADVQERMRRGSRAPVRTWTTQLHTVKTARPHGAVTGATTISFGVGGDLTTCPGTGNWFDLFPSEDSSQVPDDPARVHQISSTGRIGTLIGTPTNQFDRSQDATASHARCGVRPPSLIIPSLAVGVQNDGSNPACPSYPATRATSERWTARFWQLMTWLRSASWRPAMLTPGPDNWLSGRATWVLGSLAACLALMGPSAPNGFSSSADTSAHRDFAIAAAPEVGIPTVAVSHSSSLEGAPSPRDHAGSPVSAASSPRLGVADSTGTLAPRRGARSSASVKSTGRAAAPAGVDVSVGTLVVTSAPAGATVIMNQRNVGKTPLEISVKAGPYAVTLELDGARWNDVVLVRAGRVTRVEPQLQPVSKPGR